jgi:hypothetical protein
MAESAFNNRGIPELVVNMEDDFTDPKFLFLRNITQAKQSADGRVTTSALNIKLEDQLNNYLHK